MKKLLMLLSLAALPLAVQAQQMCVCTNGCKIASDPFALGGVQPTGCNIYRGATLLASGAVVLSSTIAQSNANTCLPASGNYNPGPAGSVACLVTIPAQAAGTTVTVTATATNAQGESVASAPFSFQSVSSLTPASPAGMRVTQ